MKVIYTSKVFSILIIITMAIAPAFALGAGNRNMLLIYLMCISPFVVLLRPHLYRTDILLILFMISIILSPLLNHPESMRWSTVLYSMMFCITFMAYSHLLIKGSLTIEVYLKIIKYLIYAYFIVLLIQQFCVLTGFPIFNKGNYIEKEPWKLNSLSSEPSHSARIVGLLMYCYVAVKEIINDTKYIFKENFKEDKWVWMAFLWTMITMGSSTAFLFLSIVLLKLINKKNLVSVIVILAMTFFLIDIMGITSIERTYKVTKATLTLNEDKIIDADQSAALRIVPLIMCAKRMNVNTKDAWFGHGIDYVSSFIYKKIPGIKKGTAGGGGMLQMAVEFGIISSMIFLIFSLYVTIDKKNYLSIILWFFLIFFNGVNSQITWLAMITLFTNHHFNKIPEENNE